MPPHRPRIALYSHDTQGLGHVRRNLLIARALTRRERSPAILLLSGIHETGWFDFPDGVDCLTVPSLAKNDQGDYEPRSLGVPTSHLIRIRQQAIEAAVRSFDPDILVVDKVPLGAFDELVPTLGMLRRRGRTRVILGLRDILDTPAAVQRDWDEQRFFESVRRYFDRIWVYGDRDMYDLIEQYDIPRDLAERTRFTGFLNPLDLADAVPSSDEPKRLVLGLVGGGRDGVALADAFARTALPDDSDGLLITGPLMPEGARRRLTAVTERNPRMTLREFVTDPLPFLRQASRVVSMGGYNTMCEIVAHRVPGLIVPRTAPRLEQSLRADRFARLGLVDRLDLPSLSPDRISHWLASSQPEEQLRDARSFDFDGITRLPGLMDETLATVGAEGVRHAAG